MKIFQNPGVPEGFKVLIKELQSIGLDVRLYSEDDQELELTENIDDGIDFNLDDNKPLVTEEEMIEDDELNEPLDESMLLEEEEIIDEEDDDLDIFDNELAEDNMENDDDSYEE